jgi:hypothetical protein
VGRPSAAPLRPGERAVTLRLPGGPYRPQAPSGGHDDYRCFLLDPGLREDAFVTGSDVLPGNPAVVHHAILFAVPPGQVDEAEAHDAATPGRGWTCFGGSALPKRPGSAARALNSAPWLAAWAPGSGGTVYGKGTGKRMPAGSRIVLQLHYNLREGDDPDDTAVRLRLMAGSADVRALRTMLLVAPVELPCTSEETGPLCDRSQSLLDLVRRFGPDAGRTVSGLQLLCGGSFVAPVAAATQSCDRRAPQDMVVQAVAGHMHLLGRSISVRLEPGSAGSGRCWTAGSGTSTTRRRHPSRGRSRCGAGTRSGSPARTTHSCGRWCPGWPTRNRVTSPGERAPPTRCASASCCTRAPEPATSVTALVVTTFVVTRSREPARRRAAPARAAP